MAARLRLAAQPDAYTFDMRLSEHQREVIRRTTAEVAGPSARVLLFGSRTRPELRGGDIDLLVELAQPSPDRWALGTTLGARIERQLGLQRSTSWWPIRPRPIRPCWPLRATPVCRSEP